MRNRYTSVSMEARLLATLGLVGALLSSGSGCSKDPLGGGPGQDGGGGVGNPCPSSPSCAAGEVCTTEDGVCDSPPGCSGADAAACPAICYGTCRVAAEDGGGPACGPTQCARGMVCCNPTCGTCTPPGGACSQAACHANPPPCNIDSDCRIAADYCTGCDCRALATGESLPACTGPGVNCLVDPCGNKSARCLNGGCVAQ